MARRSGKVIGVVGKWDQRAFRQTRVLGYGRSLRWLRPLANAVHPLLGTPKFPEPGECVPYFYVSFIAVEEDDLAVFRPLSRQIHNDSVKSDFLYFLIGLHERDPLLAALDDYSLTPFAGRLFCVCFEEGEETFRTLDNRVP